MTRVAIVLAGILAFAGGSPALAQNDALTPEQAELEKRAGAAQAPSPEPPEPPRFGTADRNRLTLSLGYWDAPSPDRSGGAVYTGVDTQGVSGGFEYSRYLSEKLAVTIGSHVLPLEAGTGSGRHGTYSGSQTIASFLLGVRWNPSPGDTSMKPVKPYVLAGIGPVIGTSSGSWVRSPWHWGDDWDERHPHVGAGNRTEATLGGRIGGGLDFHLGRNWALDAEVAYNWMQDLNEAIAGHDNYSGVEVRIGVSWLFGKGSTVTD